MERAVCQGGFRAKCVLYLFFSQNLLTSERKVTDELRQESIRSCTFVLRANVLALQCIRRRIGQSGCVCRLGGTYRYFYETGENEKMRKRSYMKLYFGNAVTTATMRRWSKNHDRCAVIRSDSVTKAKEPCGSFGASNRNRTCTVSHRILNPARLPVPPYSRTDIFYHKSPKKTRCIFALYL